MKMTINVGQPVYDASKGIVTIKLTRSNGGTSDVIIDFENLLPFASLVSQEVLDFFFLSATVYGIDRFILRRPNSVDGWSRELRVNFPAIKLQKWKAARSEVDALLSFLTGDYWEVDFYKSDFTLPSFQLDFQSDKQFSQVNLFSGGLDSLIGAIDYLQSNPKKNVLFVSHYDSQMHGPKSDQQDLIKKIDDNYSNQFHHIPSIRVSLENSTLLKETTFRSRSILFIGIALVAAKAKDIPIIVPENGTVSLNFPLSPSRRSACSTRTTHPTMMSLTRVLWDKLMIKTSLNNPYEFFTKGEMVANCKNKKLLQEVVKNSNSCGKRGHRSHWTDNREATHCGVCMPCVYRQASLQKIKDDTSYGTNLKSLSLTTQKGQDIGACLQYLNTPLSKKEAKQELLINGLKDFSRIDKYADLVLRTRKELKDWIAIHGTSEIKRRAGVL